MPGRHRLAEAAAVYVPRRRKATIRSRQPRDNQAARRAASLAVEPSSPLALSKLLSPSDRAASKDTCVGGCGAIFDNYHNIDDDDDDGDDDNDDGDGDGAGDCDSDDDYYYL